MLGGGGRGPRGRVNPAAPPRASFIAALKLGSFRQPGCSAGPPHDSPPRPAAHSRPPPGRHHHTLQQPLPKVGEGLPKGVRAPLPGGAHRPAPTRCGAPPPLPAPPARSLPSPPPSITQKLVKLVPDSWRRAPLQERKKGEKKKGKSRREGAREKEKGPQSETAPPDPLSSVVPVPPAQPGSRNPAGEPPHPGGRGRARNTDQLFMGESIIQLPREGEGRVRPGRGRAAAETTTREVAALPLGLGGRQASPRRGCCCEKAASGWAPGGARGNPQKQDS